MNMQIIKNMLAELEDLKNFGLDSYYTVEVQNEYGTLSYNQGRNYDYKITYKGEVIIRKEAGVMTIGCSYAGIFGSNRLLSTLNRFYDELTQRLQDMVKKNVKELIELKETMKKEIEDKNTKIKMLESELESVRKSEPVNDSFNP